MKPTVTLGGVTLAGSSSIAWVFRAGTSPYTTTFTVPNASWDRHLSKQVGKPLELSIRDSAGTRTTIKDVYPLHIVANDSPNRTSFVVADKRWLWAYKFIARDYNVTKKSGDRTLLAGAVLELRQNVDVFDFKPYSLKNGDTKWTPKEAVEDILELLEGEGDTAPAPVFGKVNPKAGTGAKQFDVNDFPLVDGGEFVLQNVTLRDQGDVALARLLSYIPGADIYIDQNGVAKVFDGADFDGAENYVRGLPSSTWEGDAEVKIDRSAIRPSEVNVFYQREVEIMFEFKDDYSNATAAGVPDARNVPFLRNVVPTVDPVTTIPQMYDNETGETTENVKVPAGTYVDMPDWLEAMDDTKPEGASNWDFDTISTLWMWGPLDGMLVGDGARITANNVPTATGPDGKLVDSPNYNFINRVSALRQHFRQTFRINQRYMNRIRDLQPFRVGVIDPVNATRAPATVWGQACFLTTDKGFDYSRKLAEDENHNYVQYDQIGAASSAEGGTFVTVSPSPATVEIVDRDKGIIRVNWMADPYGWTKSIIPCNTVDNEGEFLVTSRNMSFQEMDSLIGNAHFEGRGRGTSAKFVPFLRETMELRTIMTMVPGSPNNKKQFHIETVNVSDISKEFRKNFRIQSGNGPPLEIFVPPGETSARFAWKGPDKTSDDTMRRLLGLDKEGDPTQAGLEDDAATKDVDESKMNGFEMVNRKNEIEPHARSVAAEQLAAFADNMQGRIVTQVPRGGKIELKGNMSSASIEVAGAPSGKVRAVHTLPGQSKPISRFAIMSDDARKRILGIVALIPD